MDNYVLHKKRKLQPATGHQETQSFQKPSPSFESEEDSTDLKLATLASLFPGVDQTALLDVLISSDGSVQEAAELLSSSNSCLPRKKTGNGIGYQTSLATFKQASQDAATVTTSIAKKPLTRKGQTLHLYTPEDVESHTPCSIIHNFLPAGLADDLLRELLEEAHSFERQTFKMFDNVVQSPHSACFYVDNLEEREKHQTEYLYNGSFLTITPQMRKVAAPVQVAVNREIARRIQKHYPGGKKLKYQSPKDWVPNAAFVNCYKGGNESVGYHCDQLTYLGPRAIIGSLSLGVAREFRVRKIVAREEPQGDSRTPSGLDTERADAEGQIAIHLPHNSLLIMHAELGTTTNQMQEEWKHSIHPAPVIDPHPIAGNKRINSEYLSRVHLKKENRGRYMWMCHAGLTPGKESCTFFQWAEFDDDGEPPWVKTGGSH
ncbi:MAG: hypothetical protein Q9182_006454 [Xanthomendoza sp. 2 TL-2023]